MTDTDEIEAVERLTRERDDARRDATCQRGNAERQAQLVAAQFAELRHEVERLTRERDEARDDVDRYLNDIVALTDRAVIAENNIKRIRDEIVALCEDTEKRYTAFAENDKEGKFGAFAFGRIKEAKSIRNAMCEVIRAMTRDTDAGVGHDE